MYFRQAEAPDDPAPPAVRRAGSYDRAGLRNLQQLIQLRWIAVVGQVATILVVISVLLLTTVELLRRRSDRLRGVTGR